MPHDNLSSYIVNYTSLYVTSTQDLQFRILWNEPYCFYVIVIEFFVSLRLLVLIMHFMTVLKSSGVILTNYCINFDSYIRSYLLTEVVKTRKRKNSVAKQKSSCLSMLFMDFFYKTLYKTIL